MQFKGMNLCDFCFEPIEGGCACPKCGLSHETYQLDAGLLPPGTNLIGKYIIGRVLGRGGFGATYLAYSSKLNRPVAIKEYLPISISYRGKGEEKVTVVSEEKEKIFEKGAKRFFEEAKTMSRFDKIDNVVSVYEFFYANDTVYYSMEYLKGMDLKKYIMIKGGKLDGDEVLEIMKSVCRALIAVHSTQTLHRDIAPDNIFICENGDVKLIDFGAAKQVISNAQQSYSVVVKQGFAPSEQYTSKGNQGVWTDIYAFGATMYYALMGSVPPDAIDRVENPKLEFDSTIKYAHEFIDIINRCMQPKIADRYQSVIELLDDLNRIQIENDKETESIENTEEPLRTIDLDTNNEKEKKKASAVKEKIERNKISDKLKLKDRVKKAPPNKIQRKNKNSYNILKYRNSLIVCIVLCVAVGIGLYFNKINATSKLSQDDIPDQATSTTDGDWDHSVTNPTEENDDADSENTSSVSDGDDMQSNQTTKKTTKESQTKKKTKKTTKESQTKKVEEKTVTQPKEEEKVCPVCGSAAHMVHQEEPKLTVVPEQEPNNEQIELPPQNDDSGTLHFIEGKPAGQ